MKKEVVTELHLEGLKSWSSGKVREIFDLGDRLLIVATDRISAFDHILPNGIPGKGIVLTQLSRHWFDLTEEICPNHYVSCELDDLPESFRKHADVLEGRSMLSAKADMFPVECVVRGYLVGSGWKDYLRTGGVGGIELPKELVKASKLDEPIFTPATKATTGHDENISFDQMADLIGKDDAETLRDLSLRIYCAARDYAEKRGVIIADTKFEFGRVDGRITIADEMLTPDSSRFWPLDRYTPGEDPPNFDKQYVRDFLETTDWDKNTTPPALPEEIVVRTAERYREVFRILTDKEPAI